VIQRVRLNERAALDERRLSSLLHVGDGCLLWVGANGFLASHQGGAPVCLVGLYGKFRLRMRGGAWLFCQAAIIPPGEWHELDFGGEPFAALYIEPNLGKLGMLSPLLRSFRTAGRALVGPAADTALLRSLYEDRRSEEWASPAFDDLLGFSRRRSDATSIDPRLSRIVDHLHAHCEDLTPVAELARAVSLSSSRLQHLFTQEIGVPFRRYRAWARLRMAWSEIAAGSNITVAAHRSGFSDSSHFAREFRRTFGSVASDGLRRAARISAPGPLTSRRAGQLRDATLDLPGLARAARLGWEG
jgi:AraC-like DNA-binding protein